MNKAYISSARQEAANVQSLRAVDLLNNKMLNDLVQINAEITDHK